MKSILNKISSFFFFIVFFHFANAQVGINTNNPSRMLDVEGTMKVHNLNDAHTSADYDQSIVTDSNGNIDFTKKSSLLPSGNSNNTDKESFSQIYNTTDGNGDGNKILKCGKFQFSLTSTSDSKIRFRLNDNPNTQVGIYMNMEQNWDSNGYQFFQGKSYYGTPSEKFVFDSTNYTVWQNLAEAQLADFEQNVLNFQYPGDSDFYRLIIYRIKQSVGSTPDSRDFAVVCEKF